MNRNVFKPFIHVNCHKQLGLAQAGPFNTKMAIPQEIVKDVTGLYLSDNLNAQLYPDKLPTARDTFWIELAHNNPDHSGQILGLRKTIKIAQITRGQYPPQLFAIMSAAVPKFPIKDDSEKSIVLYFLTELLIAKSCERPGYLDYGKDTIAVAERLFSDFGTPDSLENVVAKALDVVDCADSL